MHIDIVQDKLSVPALGLEGKVRIGADDGGWPDPCQHPHHQQRGPPCLGAEPESGHGNSNINVSIIMSVAVCLS